MILISRSTTFVLLIVALLSVSLPQLVNAQASAKESQAYAKDLERTRSELTEFRTSLASTVVVYNALINGEVEDPQQTPQGVAKSVQRDQ